MWSLGADLYRPDLLLPTLLHPTNHPHQPLHALPHTPKHLHHLTCTLNPIFNTPLHSASCAAFRRDLVQRATIARVVSKGLG
ncbi:hypothetical protein E2C01_100732 [Portunus trituberculatus]|uniref:Uncharacterized protein n=1 Tax=Portunus trituberculatus TaxID=210409 RepID=A0A5B7KE26_PORTR|nr:hypothetical protein [Portunus trituberculatus]